VDRSAEDHGWGLIRRALAHPGEVADISPERLHEEVRRLQSRLERVKGRGGAYREVDWSAGVGNLLVKLESSAALSTYVH